MYHNTNALQSIQAIGTISDNKDKESVYTQIKKKYIYIGSEND